LSSAVEPLSGSVAFADFSRPLPLIARSDDIEPPLAERFFIDLSVFVIDLSVFIGRSALPVVAPIELCPDIVPDELIEPWPDIAPEDDVAPWPVLGVVSRLVVPGAPWRLRFMSSVAALPGVIGRFWLTVVSRPPGDVCADTVGAATARSAAIATPVRRCFIVPPFCLRLNGSASEKQTRSGRVPGNPRAVLYVRAMRALRQSLVAAATLLLAALPAAAKDELVLGITQYPANFNPVIEAMAAKTYILAMAKRPLVAFDAEWKLVCLLCTELPTIENGRAEPIELEGGGHGIKVTYTIRPEAKWGDGTPVSTDDVLFSYEVGKHPMSGVTAQEPYRRILKIETKEDKKTFTLHLDRRYFDFAARTFELLPAHVERAAFSDPAQYRTRTKYDTDTTNPALYNGPYRITEASAGSHVVLEPSPTWEGEKPRFRRIVVRAIENTAALEANVLSGGVDMVAGELGLSLDQGLAFEKRHAGKYNVIFKPGLVYEHVDLNRANAILADKRVRQALLWALDRAAITKQLFDGRQTVANTSINPLDWVHAEDIPQYKHDPAKAKALLDEAGWNQMRGGVRHNTKGERLSLELMTTAGNRSRELVQQVLQSQWKQVGVEIRIRNEPPRVFFGETVTKRNFSLALFAWISSPESVPRTTLHSREIPSAENNWSGQNFVGFKNEEIDKLIDAIEVELDRDRRKAMWKRLQEIYADDLPTLPLYFRADTYILPKWLKGVVPTGHQSYSTLWVETWRAE
jgi:peptide/nickel transport system substrate-binding protein